MLEQITVWHSNPVKRTKHSEMHTKVHSLSNLITYPHWFVSLFHSFKGSNFRFLKEITVTYFVVASGIERTWPKWISLHSVHYKATISTYNLHSRPLNQNFARASRAREARALYLHPKQQSADFLLRLIRTKSLNSWPIDSAGLDLPKAHLSSSTFHRYRPLPSENRNFFNFFMKFFIFFRFFDPTHIGNVANSDCIVSAGVDLGRSPLRFDRLWSLLLVPIENMHFPAPGNTKYAIFSNFFELFAPPLLLNVNRSVESTQNSHFSQVRSIPDEATRFYSEHPRSRLSKIWNA